ncbi:MAG: protein translocase subunit SecD, partial [Ignavibacteria bacterium]|nr:protein translocase subunit SecD [Ignavibacteria bacterium]
MRNQLSKIILIVAAVALALVFLYPSFEDYQHRTKLSSLSDQDSVAYFEQNEEDILDARLKRIKLGLDLQGGMRVVLEVDILQMLEDIAKNKDENFRTIISEVRAEAGENDESVIPILGRKFEERGIRLSRYFGSIRESDAAIMSQLDDETEKAVDRGIEVVRNRVDQYRVSEPTIQKQGGRRIIVELPGVKDEREVRRLLQGTAKLEFRLLRDADISYKVMKSIDDFLSGKVEEDTTAAKPAKTEQKPKDALEELLAGTQTSESDTSREAQFTREHPFFSYVLRVQERPQEGFVEEKNRDRVQRLLSRPDVQRLLPPDFEFLWSAKPETFPDGRRFFALYPVKRQAELTGGVIVDARQNVSPEDNRPIVNMEMNSDGSREWARITGANVGKRIAIALDNSVFSAPTVINKIIGGRSQITGLDTPNEARLLEIVLRAGALPAPVAIVEQRTVGPS